MYEEEDVDSKKVPLIQNIADSDDLDEDEDDPIVEPILCRCCLDKWGIDMYKMFVLLCICFLTFGSYWVFDTPGAIQDSMRKHFGESYTKSRNALLYSIYSYPNMILAFFGGFIVDRITGIRGGAFLFAALICTGQLLFCLGVQYKQYWVSFAGRFVFGLGGESLTVAQNAFTLRWFEGPSQALAFGLVVSFARIGSAINFVATPNLAKHEGVDFAVWFGMGMCGISLCACTLLAFLDYKGMPRIRAKQEKKARLAAKKAEATGTEVEEESLPSFRDIKHFPLSAWFLYLICLFFYIGVLTFNTVASDIMQKTGKEYSEDTAGLFLSIPNFVSIIASPLFGRLVDSVGRALNWILLASVMMIISQLAFLVLAEEWVSWMHPVPIMIWQGTGYALGAASMWPILSLVIPAKMVGTAYGCMTAIQNCGLAVFPQIISSLQNIDGVKGHKAEYSLPILVFIGCEGMAFLLTFLLIGIDKKYTEGRMNMSAAELQELKKRLAQEHAADPDDDEDVDPELVLTRASSKVFPKRRRSNAADRPKLSSRAINASAASDGDDMKV